MFDGYVYTRTVCRVRKMRFKNKSRGIYTFHQIVRNDLIKRAHERPLSADEVVIENHLLPKSFLLLSEMFKQILEFIFICDVCKQTKAPNQT